MKKYNISPDDPYKFARSLDRRWQELLDHHKTYSPHIKSINFSSCERDRRSGGSDLRCYMCFGSMRLFMLTVPSRGNVSSTKCPPSVHNRECEELPDLGTLCDIIGRGCGHNYHGRLSFLFFLDTYSTRQSIATIANKYVGLTITVHFIALHFSSVHRLPTSVHKPRLHCICKI